MPYRRTKSLSKGRREEREKQQNTRPKIDKGGSIAIVYYQPQQSGIDSSSAVKVGSVQNAFPLAGSLAGVCVVVNGGYSRQPDIHLVSHITCTASLTETKNLNHLKNCECSIRSGVVLCS